MSAELNKNEDGEPVLASSIDKEGVLLINPPGDQLFARDKYCTSVSKANYYWPQIDLLVLSGRLGHDYNVTLIDAIVLKKKPDELLLELSAKKFKAVVFLTSSASMETDLAFIEKLKQSDPETLMIGNGGYLLMQGEKYLKKYDFLDAVLLDFTTVHILDYLRGRRPAMDMITRTQSGLVRGENSTPGFFSYPFPLHDQLPVNRYVMPVSHTDRFAVSMTSIGCPHKCNFCIPSQIPFKQRELGNVMDELEGLEKLNFRHVIFHDSNFVTDRKYVKRFCHGIIKRKISLSWTCQTRVDTVDKEVLALMKRAGCKTIEFGVESGDNNVLKEMNKGVTIDQIRRAFAITRQLNIRTVGFFIIGMPGETEDSIRKTIDLAIELDCDYAAFSLPMPHPGTRLGESVRKQGWVLSERDMFDDVSRPAIDVPSLDYETVWKMRALAYRKFYLRPRYILKRIMGISTFYELTLQFKVFFSILLRLIRQYR